MFRGKDVQEIDELKREGLSIRAISRLTGYGRKTISKYLIRPEGGRSTDREPGNGANWNHSSRI